MDIKIEIPMTLSKTMKMEIEIIIKMDITLEVLFVDKIKMFTKKRSSIINNAISFFL